MALETPMGDTRLAQYDYSNPYNSANAAAQGQIISNAARSGQEAANNEADQKLKALLQGQQQTKDIESLKALRAANPAASTKVGDISVGVDPAITMQQKQMKATKEDYDNLEKHFGPQSKEIEDSASQIESGLNGLKLGTKEGDQQAITAMTRLSDGKSARLTQALLQKFTPSDSQGSFTKMMNYWTNKADSGLSPDERTSVANLLQSHTQMLHSRLNDAASEFQQQAPHFAPNLAASGQLQSAVKDFGVRAGSALSRIDSLQKEISSSPPSQIASARPGATGTAPQAADTIGSKLKSLLFGNGGAQPPAMAAPPSPPPAPNMSASPTGPAAGFDVDAYLSGK